MANHPLRIGIAGLKRGGDFLLPLIHNPDAMLAGTCDPDPETIERRRDLLGDAPIYENYSELLSSKLDAIIIATPIHLHVPQSIEALAQGIHVFSEVSAAISLQQCADLVRAVRSSSAKYMMGENCCFMREFSVVRNMARAGLFGNLYYAEADYVHEIGSWARPRSWQERWLLNRRGTTYPTHPLGTILDWLDDRLVTISCQGSDANIDPSRNNDDRCIMLGRTSRGALISLRHDLVSPRPMTHNYAGLQGVNGAYESPRYAGEEHRICLTSHSNLNAPGGRSWQPLRDFEQDFLPEYWRNENLSSEISHGGSDGAILRSFLDCIIQDTAPYIDVYRALDFTVPGLMAETSIAQGGVPVAVPDFRFM